MRRDERAARERVEMKTRLIALTKENDELRASVERKQNIARTAMRDALNARAYGHAVNNAAAAAHHFLEAGYAKPAVLILAAIQAAENEFLRGDALPAPTDSPSPGKE